MSSSFIRIEIMSLPLHTTLTVSCDESEENSGPTIVHSTGVDAYRIPPRAIQVLQEAFTNNRLCDHELGVQCNDAAASVIQAFENVGFQVTSEHEANGRKLWTITKTR